MADDSTHDASAPGTPSDILMALYMGDRDTATQRAAGVTLTLPELAAFGDLAQVAQRIDSTTDDLHTRSGDGWTALHLAAFFGNASVVVALLRAGASTSMRSQNAQGNTALHAGLAGRCDMLVISSLLAAGSDAAAVDAQGYTPLHLAASRGDHAASALLVACGALNDTRAPDGRRPSEIAVERGHDALAAWLDGN